MSNRDIRRAAERGGPQLSEALAAVNLVPVFCNRLFH